jgi:hypothetical protein
MRLPHQVHAVDVIQEADQIAEHDLPRFRQLVLGELAET